MRFYGDFFRRREPDGLEKLFIGARPDKESYEKILTGVQVDRYLKGMTGKKLLAVLTDQESA
jgi:hypothetical protein